MKACEHKVIKELHEDAVSRYAQKKPGRWRIWNCKGNGLHV